MKLVQLTSQEPLTLSIRGKSQVELLIIVFLCCFHEKPCGPLPLVKSRRSIALQLHLIDHILVMVSRQDLLSRTLDYHSRQRFCGCHSSSLSQWLSGLILHRFESHPWKYCNASKRRLVFLWGAPRNAQGRIPPTCDRLHYRIVA